VTEGVHIEVGAETVVQDPQRVEVERRGDALRVVVGGEERT
jgi:hypothetical protein